MMPLLSAISLPLVRSGLPGSAIKTLACALALPCLLGAVSVSATPVYPDNMPKPGPDSESLEDRRRFTMQLMETAALPLDKPITVPELADPMAMGRDTGLTVFDSKVHHVDLLANPVLDDPDLTDIELPRGSLRGIDIVEDLEALYLSYDGRAFDKSVLDVGNAEVIEYRNVPHTTEGTPLSLMGFGNIVDNRRP